MNIWIAGKDVMKHHCKTKKELYSSLNIEDISDIDYRHAKRVFKYFSNKNLGDYYDLHIQGDILLRAEVFENFRNMYFKIYELARFLSAL